MRFVKQLAVSALGAGPIYATLRTLSLRQHPTLILCYHSLGPDDEVMDAWTVARVSEFRRQIEFLRHQFDIVSLDDALQPCPAPNRPRAVITFDDGDVGLFSHLLPIVEAEALPVTLYIATAQIESGQPYWFDHIMNALQNTGATVLTVDANGPKSWTVGPETGAARWAVISDILDTLKQVQPDQRQVLTQSILDQAGPNTSEATQLAPLTRAQLEKLAQNPHVTIGAHSHCHNLLDQIPLEQAEDSIRKSRVLLQDWTGQPVDHFAYPNGNHTPALHKLVQEVGFSSATILGQTLCQPAQTNPYALPRVLVGRYDSLARLRLRFIGY